MSAIDSTATLAAGTARPSGVPRHLGVILDGNRRWARSRGLPLQKTYQAGTAKVPEFLTWCERAQIPVVSLWALSVDNLQRCSQDIAPLLDLIVDCLQQMAAQRPWRLRLIGRLDLLPEAVADQLRAAEETTVTAPGLLVNIAVAYDGRADIVAAVQELLALGLPARCGYDTLERLLAERLSTAGQPGPDLIIRTSGEMRTSGFLLWQGAQAELYFTATPWPDIQEHDLGMALAAYCARHRRYGR
ncbi:polyprenyl diphosphate synthase [Streptomyces olivoreticuli]